MSDPEAVASHRSPPLHAPGERALRILTDGWEVRDFAPDDAKAAWLGAHGLHHLQLWHPRARVSVLTPSPMTAGAYEAFPIRGHRLRADLETVRRAVAAEHGLRLPSAAQLRAWVTWCALSAERTAPDGRAQARP